MSNPRDHHYIPEFYLDKWANDKGNVCVYSPQNNEVIRAFFRHPGGTGYQRDLYRIEGVPLECAQVYEADFFTTIDNDAAIALSVMLRDGVEKLDEGRRHAWIRFIVSLRLRTPEKIEEIRREISDIYNAAIESFKLEIAAAGKTIDTIDDLNAIESDYFIRSRVSSLDLVAKLIDSDNFIDHFENSYWRILSVNQSNIGLLTSDRPVHTYGDNELSEAFLCLPISPDSIFVSARSPSVLSKLSGVGQNKLAREANLRVVAQAQRFVWGNTASHLSFVRKNMGRIPDEPVVPAHGKELAMQMVSPSKKAPTDQVEPNQERDGDA